MTDKPQQLYSATYLAQVLGVDRETIHRALRAGRLEEPAAMLNTGGRAKPVAGWTADQVEQIQRTWKPGKPGRPPKGTQGDVPPTGGHGAPST